jgi:hypothetical protein
MSQQVRLDDDVYERIKHQKRSDYSVLVSPSPKT